MVLKWVPEKHTTQMETKKQNGATKEISAKIESMRNLLNLHQHNFAQVADLFSSIIRILKKVPEMELRKKSRRQMISSHL